MNKDQLLKAIDECGSHLHEALFELTSYSQCAESLSHDDLTSVVYAAMLLLVDHFEKIISQDAVKMGKKYFKVYIDNEESRVNAYIKCKSN